MEFFHGPKTMADGGWPIAEFINSVAAIDQRLLAGLSVL